MTNKLTHFDEAGAARMVNVSEKPDTAREAVAAGRVIMLPATLRLILDRKVTKGDVFGVSRIAGIMAAKKTADLIPLCHPLSLTSVDISFEADEKASCVNIQVTVTTTGQTGVEMEALTAVSATCLTIYDMCKAVDRGMTISDIKLMKKTGGKSGTFVRK
jgi:cyclic pyranopterin phosphate synthase